MIIVETKHFKNHEGTIVYTEGQCMIQNMILDDTTLEEVLVPLLEGNNSDMAIIIDDTLSEFFKSFKIVHFDDTHAHFGEISYRYQKGDVLTWGSRLPKLIALMDVPKILPSGNSEIKISGNRMIMGDTFEKNIFYKFENFDGTIHVNMDLLKKVFEKHSDEPFKLYLEDEFPIGIEFLGTTNVRYYVAPLEI